MAVSARTTIASAGVKSTLSLVGVPALTRAARLVLPTLIMASQQEVARLTQLLCDSVRQGELEQAALALEQGADVNWHNPNLLKITPLQLAADKGNESVVRLLLDRRASIDAADAYNRTALHNAAYRGNESVVRLLLDRGADVTVVSVRARACVCVCAIECRALIPSLRSRLACTHQELRRRLPTPPPSSNKLKIEVCTLYLLLVGRQEKRRLSVRALESHRIHLATGSASEGAQVNQAGSAGDGDDSSIGRRVALVANPE